MSYSISIIHIYICLFIYRYVCDFPGSLPGHMLTASKACRKGTTPLSLDVVQISTITISSGSQSDIGDPFPSIWWCIKIRTCYLGTACSQDKFIKRVQRIHQQITEQTSTTEHEFYSEQDMVDAGWSELLGF